MTHTLSRRLSSAEEWYEIYFDQTWQTLIADKYLPSPSVETLERGINENLAAMGVPVECTLYPYCDYGNWYASFRFTTLDDPDYSYPQPNLENLTVLFCCRCGDLQEFHTQKGLLQNTEIFDKICRGDD